jgi:hypothetical protein
MNLPRINVQSLEKTHLRKINATIHQSNKEVGWTSPLAELFAMTDEDTIRFQSCKEDFKIS